MHDRRSVRLAGYDYRSNGAYFVTVCTRRRACIFGDVIDGAVRLNEMGHIAEACWAAISEHFSLVTLDAAMVMPNHIHGIIVIDGVWPPQASPLGDARDATRCRQSPGGLQAGSIAAIVGSFKSASTKHTNRLCGTPGAQMWQRNYFEHVIRDEDDLNEIRRYIADNPIAWALDPDNQHA
jgi:putative transposase